jgi:hypothetical protein
VERSDHTGSVAPSIGAAPDIDALHRAVLEASSRCDRVDAGPPDHLALREALQTERHALAELGFESYAAFRSAAGGGSETTASVTVTPADPAVAVAVAMPPAASGVAVGEVKAEHDRLVAEIATLVEERDEIRHGVGLLQVAIAQRSEELEQLDASVQERRTAPSAPDPPGGDARELEARAAELAKVGEELARGRAEQAELRAEIERARAQLDATLHDVSLQHAATDMARAELVSVRDELERLHAQRAEQVSAAGAADALRSDLESLHADADEARAELARLHAARAEHATATADTDAIRADLERLRAATERTRGELEELRSQHTEQADATNAVRTAADGVRAELETLRAQRAADAAAVDAARAELDALHAHVVEARTEVDQLEVKRGELEAAAAALADPTRVALGALGETIGPALDFTEVRALFEPLHRAAAAVQRNVLQAQAAAEDAFGGLVNAKVAIAGDLTDALEQLAVARADAAAARAEADAVREESVRAAAELLEGARAEADRAARAAFERARLIDARFTELAAAAESIAAELTE